MTTYYYTGGILVIIYRPYENIKDSVKCLSRDHLVRVGKIETFILIRSILKKLGLIQENIEDFIEGDPTFIFYWNKGKPYLCDLILYHNCAAELYPKLGGVPKDWLKPYTAIIENNWVTWHKNKFEWTADHARTHKLLLLDTDHYWYKRHFRSLRTVNPMMFYKRGFLNVYDNNGKPVKITSKEINRRMK